MTLQARSRSSASVSHLWDVVSDVTHWPEHLETFTEVREVDSSAKTDVGRRFAVRQPGLPPAMYEVTEWTEDQSFTWVARSPGVTTRATHVVTAREAGSELALTVDWRGPLASVVRLLAGRTTQRFIDLEASTLAVVAQPDE